MRNIIFDFGMRNRLFLVIATFAMSFALPASARRVVLTDYAAACERGDWRKAFEAAMREGDTVVVPAGVYRCSKVRIPSGKVIVGEGDKSVLQQIGKTMFEVGGSVGNEMRISKHITDFSDCIALVSTDGLQAGDDILLVGQRNSMMFDDCGEKWCLGRTDKKFVPFGEFLTIAEVTGNSIRTTAKTRFPFYRKDDRRETVLPQYKLRREATTVSRVQFVKGAVLRDLTIAGDSTARYGVHFRYAAECSAKNVRIVMSGLAERYNAFAVDWSRDVVCRGCAVETDPTVAEKLKSLTEIGFKAYSRYNMYRIMASTRCGFDGCSCDFSTHGFNISSAKGWIPATDCFVRNCTARNDLWAGVIVQQGCIGCILENNTVVGAAQGVVSGGRNTLIRGNRVLCTLPLTTNYYYAHIKRGGTSGIGLFEGFAYGSVIEDNTVEGAYTGILITDGYERNNIFTHGKAVVRNNRVSRCVNGLHIYRNKHNTSPSAFRVEQSGNTYTDMTEAPNRE